ncbi:TonB-linked outer membrane protein, SusC/RagA family [Xylanibacter oryzae DSM 17970]|uniref:TonB-linked outer membrane protein, SusC/RagA family n=1 Tax=Xylanibacter oryzae DSM 17970 TaxID=915438 RepID=A0ABN0RU61_9BACT|nr:TonB-dependent receptor [Xylanibacter oryzae]EXG77771.1 TonB-linked outer membrane protein, SusC/RagA family [Xylanibacter oryzae DSM 17970]
MKHVKLLFVRVFPVVVLLMAFCLNMHAQSGITIKGVVTDQKNESVIGASVVVKGRPGLGTISDLDGHFTISVPNANSVIVISYVGMKSKEMKVGGMRNFKVVLDDDNTQLGELVVVGYGQQKKASVVGAITQTTGDVLKRAAGVNDIGSALTGNLPGVVTTASSGMPGAEEPKIVIRSASSWNNSDPLVLVDGIERPMSSVDISSVKTISVLKDASATAVYGVKGANGVILITTKRGEEGRAKIDVSATMTVKAPSYLPSKYDSYDALMYRNTAIEHELPISPDSWSKITPQSTIDMYRDQTTTAQRERYPNVDWQKTLFKDYCMSYNANVNISGGTKFVKYFVATDYVHEGDLYRQIDNGRGYNSGYGFNRLNVRSNLDFQLTKTTVFKMNLAGSAGTSKSPWSNSGQSDWQIAQQWAGAYNIAPDVFLPVYSDGSWGYYPNGVNVSNSAEGVSISGVAETTTTRINTDFTLEQDLSFITKGLRASGMIAWDNTFVEGSRGVSDLYNDPQHKWIDPATGTVYYKTAFDNNNKFDYQQGVLWSTSGGSVNDYATQRNLNYQLQLNWGRDFGKHNVTAMGLFARQQYATGSEVPHYREDWVFRTTYNYADKYFVEYNGAYNGSEKFSKDNRFAFFNSGALGWMISEEKFIKDNLKFLDMLKIRASYGEIGDDNVGSRWLYMSQWAYGGTTAWTSSGYNSREESPYTWYREASVGNPNVKWETVKKTNLGIDYAFLNGMFAGSVDFFHDKRFDILVGGSDRSVPSYYGNTAPTANLGQVTTHGYEFELRFNKNINRDLHIWANFNMTHAVNKILVKDDPELLPAYQKQAGYSMGQYKSYISSGHTNTYDQIYGSTKHDANDASKLPGDYNIIDFNADGVIDSKDQVPYGYSSTPQNTYNATIGFEWKGFSGFVQFYGVTNVTRDVVLTSFAGNLDNVYDQGAWWSKYSDGDVVVPRWNSKTSYNDATQYLYDGSYIRLKNAEVAYTFNNQLTKKLGISNLKIFINGNNLWMWSRMPDDREMNNSFGGSVGAYPTMKRYNLGIKFSL